MGIKKNLMKVLSIGTLAVMGFSLLINSGVNLISVNAEDDYISEKERLADDHLTIDYSVTTLSEETQKVLEDYKNGNADKYKELRKEKAESTGLIAYCDADYFLNRKFIQKYDPYILAFDNLQILNKEWTPEGASESAEILNRVLNGTSSQSSGISLFKKVNAAGVTVTDFSDSNYWTFPGTAASWSECVYRLSNNHIAFCSEANAGAISKGMALSDPVEQNNDNLRKVLYYGFQGPNDILSGTLGEKGAISLTSEFCSMANAGYAGSQTSGTWAYIAPYYSQIMSMPSPPKSFKVFKCSNGNSSMSWQGAYTKSQDVVYWENVEYIQPWGEITLNKTFDGESSATTSFSTSNTYIKDEYKDYVNADSEAGKDAKKTYKIVTPSKSEAESKDSTEESTDKTSKTEEKTDTSDITVELNDNGNKSTIKWSDFTTTEKTETPVQGNVTFTVTAGCDIKMDDETTNLETSKISKGTVLKFVKSDDKSYRYQEKAGDEKVTLTNGQKLSISYLPIQKGTTTYIVQEQTTYENYVLDTKTYTFTFERTGNEADDYEFVPKEQTNGSFTIDNESIKIHTTATNAEVEDGKEINNSSIVKLTDKVAYSGLTIGKEYKVTGTLMNKDTGLPVLDSEGKQVTGETTFTAETEEGTVNVDFVFDASALGGSQVVVYENLFNLETGSIIAQHEDIEDEDQTVDVNEVLIHTTATVNDSHQAEAKGNITLKDKVYFDNLTEGMEYTVTGVLMDKTTGQPLLVNGKEVTASNTFTAKGSKNGYTTVEFNFDATGLEGKDLVVFETCTHTVVTTDEDGNEKKEETTVAEHKDINDTDQTISFAPKTGTGTDVTPYIACGAGAVAILAVVLVLNKKKKN